MPQIYPSYDVFLASHEWQSIRIKALERAQYRCQICNSGETLHVHHRSYQNSWGSESLDDLVVLCKGCHYLFHKRGGRLFNLPAIKKHRSIKPKKKKNKKKEKRKYRVRYKNGNEEVVSLEPCWANQLQRSHLVSCVTQEK